MDGHQEYEGKFWRPDEMFMENHQTKKEYYLEVVVAKL